MFRRTVRRLQAQNFRQQTDKESERIYSERRRQMLYDAAGNLQLGGLVQLLWEDFHKPLLGVVGFIALFYGYTWAIVKLSRDGENKDREFSQRSEQLARQSGKLKSDRYLVRQNRQIEDPDFLNVPSYGGKGVYKSRLLSDDEEFERANKFSENSRSS